MRPRRFGGGYRSSIPLSSSCLPRILCPLLWLLVSLFCFVYSIPYFGTVHFCGCVRVIRCRAVLLLRKMANLQAFVVDREVLHAIKEFLGELLCIAPLFKLSYILPSLPCLPF
jgi:amino acid permease